MSLAIRTANAARPLKFALSAVYFVIRVILAVGIGIALGHVMMDGPMSQLDGAVAFALGAGVIACYIAMPWSLGSVGLHWGLVEIIRVPLIALFIAVALAARRGLEHVVPFGDPAVSQLLASMRLGFLETAPVIWRVPLALLVGAVSVAVIVGFLRRIEKAPVFDGPNEDEVVIRGPRRVPYPIVRERSERRFQNEPCISWILVPLSIGLARLGLRLVGATGTGKTILLTNLVRSFAVLVQRGDGLFRASILDVKNDYRMILRALIGLLGYIRVHLLHPFDQDSECWDMAADLTKETTRPFAQALFRNPDDAKQDPFWLGLMHLTVTAALNGIIERYGNNWTFATFLIQMASEASIREAISWDPNGVENVQALELLDKGTDDKLRNSLFFTIVERCGDFLTIAAGMRAQYERNQRFSLRSWATESSIVVFGWAKNHDAEMRRLHCAFFAVQAYTILDVGAEGGGQLILLDELPGAGPIGKDLAKLSREGRDLNVIPVLAYQSKAALDLEFGEEEAAAAIAEQQFVAALGCANEPTASELSKSFGEVEIERTQRSTTTQDPSSRDGAPQSSTTENRVRETKPLISAAQIQCLPLINPAGERGPTAFATDDEGNVYQVHYPMSAVRREVPKVRKFRARPFTNLPALRRENRKEDPQPPAAAKRNQSKTTKTKSKSNGSAATKRTVKRSLADRLNELDLQ